MSTIGEVGRIRRQQIVNLSITELMLLLVFMAVTFSFLAKEEDLREIPLIQKELAEVRAENQRLTTRIRELEEERARLIDERDLARQQVADLERQLKQFLPDASAPKPNEPMVTIPEATYKQLKARNVSLEKLAQELQSENAALRVQQGGKAPGLPRCLITSGFLLTITLLADGSLSGLPTWDAGAERIAVQLPGVQQLSSGQPLTAVEFSAAASALNKWATSQSQPCRFSVREVRKTTSVDIYDRQLDLIDSFFYSKRSR